MAPPTCPHCRRPSDSRQRPRFEPRDDAADPGRAIGILAALALAVATVGLLLLALG